MPAQSKRTNKVNEEDASAAAGIINADDQCIENNENGVEEGDDITEITLLDSFIVGEIKIIKKGREEGREGFFLGEGKGRGNCIINRSVTIQE